jgi:hypothetical protein
MAMAMATTTKPPTSAQTTASLADLETLITDITNLQVELSPSRSVELANNIRCTKQSVHSLLLSSNFSLKDKIAYEQQKHALARQKRVLAEMGMRKEMWADVLKKAREEKKQLRRLEKVQLEYEGVCRASPTGAARAGDCSNSSNNNTEEHKAELEKKMIIAMGRTVRAGKTYGAMLARLDADVKKIKEDTEWYRKQAELDEKALERAKVARKAKTLKSEMMRCENLRMEEQWKEVGVGDEDKDEDEWLPEQYKAKAKAKANAK